jgi:EAL domain-containing protein (putative c-di-GMP-specific phosphodiesterase class I)
LTIAQDLGMSTTAEGVETMEQFDRLRVGGVTFAQGYLFGKPVPAAMLDFDRPAGNVKLSNVA